MTNPLRWRRPGRPPVHDKLDPNPFAALDTQELVGAPGPWLLMLQARAPWEYAAMLAAIRGTPPCPTTSIYSKSDGVVARAAERH